MDLEWDSRGLLPGKVELRGSKESRRLRFRYIVSRLVKDQQ